MNLTAQIDVISQEMYVCTAVLCEFLVKTCSIVTTSMRPCLGWKPHCRQRNTLGTQGLLYLQKELHTLMIRRRSEAGAAEPERQTDESWPTSAAAVPMLLFCSQGRRCVYSRRCTCIEFVEAWVSLCIGVFFLVLLDRDIGAHANFRWNESVRCS